MGLLKQADSGLIKQYVAVNIKNAYNTILPDLNYADDLYIKKVLGDEQYANLLAKYEADSIVADSDDAKLLRACQAALINLAYGIYTVIGQVTISESGVRIQVSDEYKTAFEWQVESIRNNYFFRKGDFFLDELMAFLEEKKDVFTLWKNSSAYSITKQFFITTAGEFDSIYGINNSRRTFLAFGSIMKKVEEFNLMPVLGQAFYDEIKAELLTDDGASAENAELLPMLKAAQAHLTIARACNEMSVEVLPNAVVVNESFSAGNVAHVKKTSPNNLLQLKITGAEADAGVYLNRLKEKLNAEASESKYATYFGSDLYVDPELDNGSYLKQDTDSGIYNAFG